MAICLSALPVVAQVGFEDVDGDGAPDRWDNCSQAVNPAQIDTDQDGLGNRCDGDFDGDGSVNILDFGTYFLRDLEARVDGGSGTDMDGDGAVTILDFGLFLSQLAAGQPGPGRVTPPEQGLAGNNPLRVGWIDGAGFRGLEVTFEDVEGEAVFEGDILLGTTADVTQPPSEVVPDGLVINDAKFRWPGGIVYYEIAPEFYVPGKTAHRNEIFAAIQHWEENTPIRFEPRSSADSDYVRFVTSSRGCSSFVGRIGGMQKIRLAQGCHYGAIVHEIGHAVGLWHEQGRSDRDEFVLYEPANVESASKRHNFDQHIGDGVDIGRYDFFSIMHYGAFAFAVDGNHPTLRPLGPGISIWDIGQRNGLSEGDVQAVHAMYDKRLRKLPEFGMDAGSWDVDRHPRMLADVDNDGHDDIVGFGDQGVVVALAVPGGYDTARLWVAGFGYVAGDWRTEFHIRTTADVNGDGRADVVGFGDRGVFVSLSFGTGMTAPIRWSSSFGYADVAGGWRKELHPRMLADVNRDGMDDIVGFAAQGVYVSLSTGSGFSPASRWVDGFTTAAGGWSVANHPRMMADVDGDGMPDVVGFGNRGVYVSLSRADHFTPIARWNSDFGYDAGDWRTELHVRTMADVNADGRDDIVGFGTRGVSVALSTGSSFEPSQLWTSEFGTDDGWDLLANPRFVADIDGDQRADIVGFDDDQVVVARSLGFDFRRTETQLLGFGGLSTPSMVSSRNPRMLGDIDNDGFPEVVGFASDGVYTGQLGQ